MIISLIITSCSGLGLGLEVRWDDSSTHETFLDHWDKAKVRLLSTHRSPGLNSRENFVLFFLCFLFRLRMESGMLFLRLGARPPL